MYCKVSAPGSCGELVQGVVNNRWFLVTCPINLYSEVTVELIPNSTDIWGPADCTKTLDAVKKTFHYFGQEAGAYIDVKSNLPRGKGLASSTADIAAACLATAHALGKQLSLKELAQLCLMIEPSDGIFLPGIAIFDHINGSIARTLGQAPPLRILVIDFGGEVDTITFNQREDLEHENKLKEKHVRRALQMVVRGLRRGAIESIGEGATLSAKANQSILYRPQLDELVSVAQNFGACGINVAHSGTVVGLLFAQAAIPGKLEREITKLFPHIHDMFLVKVIDGGLTVLS